MAELKKKTYAPKAKEVIRKWYLIDLKEKTLGRAAAKIVNLLRGKNKTFFSPSVDCGDFVVAINAAHVKLTGKKMVDKKYRHHSKYKGGLKEFNAERMLAKKPWYLIFHAVKGMIPRNKLRDVILKRFKVYAETEHPHEAQKPEKFEITRL